MPEPDNVFAQARRRLKWTQQQLAAALGVDRTTVARKETGMSRITHTDRLAIEKILAEEEHRDPQKTD